LYKVTVTWHGGSRFVGRGGSGPPVLIGFVPGETLSDPPAPSSDGDGDGAGRDNGRPPAGPWPTELLLIAVGACTGYDVLSILEKKRIEFMGLHIEVSGRRSPDHPRFFTDVEVLYRLEAGPEAKAGLERAAALSMEKYCGVSLSLRADKTWRCEVVPPG